MDTVKDALWSLISTELITCTNPPVDRKDRVIEKSFFRVIDIFGIVDLALIFLTLYSWNPSYSKEFQRERIFKDKIYFDFDELYKIITQNLESGLVKREKVFSQVLANLPPENPRKDEIFFFCSSTEDPKHRVFKNVLLRNIQAVHSNFIVKGPFWLRLASKLKRINISFPQWRIPIFQYLGERLTTSPEFAMSFFRVIAEFVVESNYKDLPLPEHILKSPQGLQRLWGVEVSALDLRKMYHSKGPFSLWPPETSESDLIIVRRIRFNLLDDAPLSESKLGICMLFVIFLILHGVLGTYDRVTTFSNSLLTPQEIQFLIDERIPFTELKERESLRRRAEERWKLEELPKRKAEIESILQKREERNSNSSSESAFTKAEAYALCMTRPDVPVKYCYSLIPSSQQSATIIWE